MKNRYGFVRVCVVAMLATGCEVVIVGGDGSGQNNDAGQNNNVDQNDGSGQNSDESPDASTNGTDTTDAGVDVDSNGASADSKLAKFADPGSEFETTDVRDVDGEIMRFDTATEELVWQLDGSRIANWRVEGTSLLVNGGEFRVRFGTQEGERRAFFTEVSPPTICNLVVTNGVLSIFPTNVQVPQE